MSQLEHFLKFPTQKSKTSFVIDEIVKAIEEQRYHVGDRLPSERALAESIGIGRAAVREAFSALQVMGVIERHIGDGTYVAKEVKILTGIDTTLEALRENESLSEVWEVRRILETILARLAIDKATQADLKEIARSLSQIEEAIALGNYDDYASADRDFHLNMAAAAKNPFLERALLPVVEITHQQVATRVDARYIAQHGKDMIERHRAIFCAIRDKDKTGIKAVVKKHFVASEKLFLSQNDIHEEDLWGTF